MLERNQNVMTDHSLPGLHVQYGCGMSAPTTWANFDSSPTLRFEHIPVVGRLYKKNKHRFPGNIQYGDIVKGLPVTPGSCAAVYASHILEHLHLQDCRTALRNTLQLLMPSGIFRVIVPDLEAMAKKYLSSTAVDAAERFLLETDLGHVSGSKGFIGFFSAVFGRSRHLWMWDYKGLAQELSAAQFCDIRPCSPGDSEDPLFKDVENPERFIDAVAIQCCRPKE